MQDGVAQWRAAMQAQGWTVASGPAERGGWPLAAELTLPGLSVTGAPPEFPAGAAWRSADATFRLDLLHPACSAAAVLRATGGPAGRRGGGAVHRRPPRRKRCHCRPSLRPVRRRSMRRRSASARRRRADGRVVAGTGEVARRPRRGARRGLAAAERGGDHAAAAAGPQARLGPHIASATVAGALTGPLPALGGPATRWRRRGGAAAARSTCAALRSAGDRSASPARASLSFDAAHAADRHSQSAAGRLRRALAALVAGHVLSAHVAQAARAVLGLMAQPRARQALASRCR